MVVGEGWLVKGRFFEAEGNSGMFEGKEKGARRKRGVHYVVEKRENSRGRRAFRRACDQEDRWRG